MEYCPYEPVITTAYTASTANQTMSDIINTQMIEQTKSVSDLLQIKNELLQCMKSTTTAELLQTIDIEENEDIKTHSTRIKESVDIISKTMIHVKQQQDKVLTLEKEYKEIIEQTSTDIEIIETFMNFVMKTHEKYKDIDIKSLEEKIVETCTEMRHKNRCQEVKQKYQKELYIMNLYIQDFLKVINQNNLGSTCGICLQSTIDTYMDPCGHTGCKDCIDRLKSFSDNESYNCYICRKPVHSFRSIYFS